jgi:hypothetical protein
VRRWTIPVCPDCGERIVLAEDGHYHGRETNFHDAEQVEVVPLSEVRDALLGAAQSFEREADEIEAEMNTESTQGHIDGFIRRRHFETLRACATALREQLAAFPSDSEERKP